MKLGIATILCALNLACTPSSTEQNAVTAGAYEADQLACIDKATSRAEADACRCTVKARYGRPCNLVADAGVPVLAQDGGSK